MSFLQPTGSQWRTPELGKSVVVSSWRGVTRVQSWPKKRGTPKTKDERNRLEIFRQVQRLIKALFHREVEYERESLKAHNNRNRGQRGSAAIRLRDWQTQRLYGRGLAIDADIGVTFWPPAVSRDASFILDHCTADHGQCLQRSDQTWNGVPHGKPGQILASGGPGKPNLWRTF